MHTADVISGDFSIVAPNCYKIENGEITSPLEPVSIAGNLYKAFKQIISLGNDTTLTPFGKMPSIAFKGFTISGWNNAKQKFRCSPFLFGKKMG